MTNATANFIVLLLLVSIATSAISLTISRAKIFEWLRKGLLRRRPPGKFLAELVSCPYCVSHWVALALVWAYPLRFTEGYFWLDLIVLTAAVVGISAVISGKVYAAVASIGGDDDAGGVDGN